MSRLIETELLRPFRLLGYYRQGHECVLANLCWLNRPCVSFCGLQLLGLTELFASIRGLCFGRETLLMGLVVE